MTHLLPQHADLNLAHQPTLQTTLTMDANQQPLPPPPQQEPQPGQQPRKRKKADVNGDDAPHPAEPRRLRRSHEACARCRSKKIKASPAGRHRRQIPVHHPPPTLRLTSLFQKLFSAIQNIQDAQRAQRRAWLVTRRTGTGRR